MEDFNGDEKMNRLVDELIDNVINTPDDEILKEVEEDYGDPSYIANRMRGMIKKCQAKIKKGNWMETTVLNYEELCFVLNCVTGMGVQKDEDDYELAQQVIKKIKTMKRQAKWTYDFIIINITIIL